MEKSVKVQLEEKGYAVVRGLLHPSTDLEHLKTAYSELIDKLSEIYAKMTGSGMPENNNRLTFADKLCYLTGISHGKAFHHLDPVLSVLDKSYTWDRDLPSAQLPEMFDLICNPAIISIINECIGPEIYSAPLFHNNIKLPREQLTCMEEISIRYHGCIPGDSLIYNFFLGTTAWHTDSYASLADARESNIINAWIPLTESTTDNGCLFIVPGSHRIELPRSPFPEDITSMGVPVEAVPGDVVFIGHNTLHCSLENTSNRYRWAFNTRYCVAGESSGRPYLPGFVAHSNKKPSRVLKDSAVWQQMWRNALENISNIQPLPLPQETSLSEAVAISRYWEEKIPGPDAWLNLNK